MAKRLIEKGKSSIIRIRVNAPAHPATHHDALKKFADANVKSNADRGHEFDCRSARFGWKL